VLSCALSGMLFRLLRQLRLALHLAQSLNRAFHL
jgi:hypothetical protein